MDARQAELLAQADAHELGRRLRSIRVSRGLTQGEVVGDTMSVAYLSRLETGARRPTVKALTALAMRLDVTIDSLLEVDPGQDPDEVRLALDYAELALESGEPDEAAQHIDTALNRLDAAGAGVRERAKILHARSLEASGREDDAIIEFEALLEGESLSGLGRIKVGIALSRIYRETGDLGRAITCGEDVLSQLSAAGLDASDEAVQLSVTVAAAYFERGDTSHAVRLCSKAIAQAETLDSSRARASAYWNASVMQANRGDIAAAVPLAERALALLSEGQDARNLARLRTEVGRLQLELDPPAVDEARENLTRAVSEMEWSSASPTDRAWTLLGLARAAYLSGELVQARELISEVEVTSSGHAPLAEAEALTLAGRTCAAENRMDEAADFYQQAVLRLSAIGADKAAAQLWFDLAALLESVDLDEAARDAYRRAAASTGLRARTTAPAVAHELTS
ncbi:helix-turn-helix domain-containing protein [Nocardioides sp. zg-1230]|uniref:helix-turn-helix domain-containing protein n=1 Tax=Nocardioides sp. zg-1230 TaxID=2736601 RepID=UPI001556C2BA|nr:helix-turn-helix transcriptional regulator [Nocardioides sp. zg-1230]NPC41223.1 helix-turn-helix domain-containing protein [Nocardioides sp. zg-1230]